MYVHAVLAAPCALPSFEDLASRFERPDAKNRWDAPLFTVSPGGAHSELPLQPCHPDLSRNVMADDRETGL